MGRARRSRQRGRAWIQAKPRVGARPRPPRWIPPGKPRVGARPRPPKWFPPGRPHRRSEPRGGARPRGGAGPPPAEVVPAGQAAPAIGAPGRGEAPSAEMDPVGQAALATAEVFDLGPVASTRSFAAGDDVFGLGAVAIPALGAHGEGNGAEPFPDPAPEQSRRLYLASFAAERIFWFDEAAAPAAEAPAPAAAAPAAEQAG